MTAPPWFWLIVAALALWGYGYCIWIVWKPRPNREGTDWFWGPDSDGWVEVKPEQTDRQESKPTSGAD